MLIEASIHDPDDLRTVVLFVYPEDKQLGAIILRLSRAQAERLANQITTELHRTEPGNYQKD